MLRLKFPYSISQPHSELSCAWSPSISSQHADREKADAEQDKRTMVHEGEGGGGYEVPRITMRIENLDSDRDFVQEQPSQVSFAIPLSCSVRGDKRC